MMRFRIYRQLIPKIGLLLLAMVFSLHLSAQYRVTIENGGTTVGPFNATPAGFGSITSGCGEEVVGMGEAPTDFETGALSEFCTASSGGASVEGKIAFISRGSCEFGQKCLNAQNEGAIAVVVCNNTDDPLTIIMGPGELGDQVTIPCFMVSQADCAPLRAALEGGTVTLAPDLPTFNEDDRVIWGGEEGQGDFSGGFNDWTTVGVTTTFAEQETVPIEWQWGTEFPAPLATPAIEAPSTCDGSVIFDSQSLIDLESSDPLSFYSGFLISPVIDLSASVDPILSFYQYQIPLNGVGAIQYTTDGGDSFSEFVIVDTENVLTSVETNIVGTEVVEIPFPELAGESQVQFLFLSISDAYFWVIDDVRIIERNTLAADRTEVNVGAFAGTDTINLDANIEWTLSVDEDWLSVTPTSGNTDAQLAINYGENESRRNSRTATITVSSTEGLVDPVIITVNQERLRNFIKLNPDTLMVDMVAGSSSFAVESDQLWSATESEDWLSISPNSGFGDGAVDVTYDENTADTARVGMINVSSVSGSSAVLIVIQEGAGIQEMISADPSDINVDASAGEAEIRVSSNTNWVASGGDDWISYAPSTGEGDDIITVKYDENTSLDSRQTSITLSTGAGETATVVITQSGAAAFIAVDPMMINVGEGEGDASVAVNSNDSWTASSDSEWLIAIPDAGSGDANVIISYLNNSSIDARTGTITFTAASGETATVTVNQDGRPRVTVVDIVVNSDVHNTLETAVVAAELAGTLSGDGPFTVFAPTDDAFAALPEGTLDALLADPTGDLANILLYHVLGAKVLSTDLMDGQVATTLLGEDITVTINENGVFINGAQVTAADIETDNGVVHVIDAVLLPPVNCDEVVEGGTVALEDGSTEATIIAGDGEADVLSFMSMGAAADASFAYVITDDQNNILGIPDGNMQDFEGAGPGVCRVWGLSYTGEITAMGGDNAAEVDLSSECFELSSNFITVTREEFMLPATVVDIVVNSDVHNTLEAAVIAAELADDLSGEGPFTVFAPTDDAFAALPEGTVEALLQDPTGDLANILLYHVLGAKVLSTDLMDGQVATTLLGEDITVTINDDGVFINDAQVIVADLEAQNGVVHVIDAVLLPPADPTEGNVIVNELSACSQTVELKNVGDSDVDISEWQLCNFPAYAQVGGSGVTVVSGDLMLSPGEIVVLGWDAIATDAGEMGLYRSGPFGDAANIRDYVQYGSGDNRRAIVAVEAGVWDNVTSFIELPSCDGDNTISVDNTLSPASASETNSSSWCSTAGSLGAENADCGTATNCDDLVAGGTVALEDGSTEATIIAGDGVADVLSFMSMGAAADASFTYVITDDQNNILGIPDGNMQDFEGAGPGICRVWGLSYTGEITAMGGDNAAEVDLSSECFELSSNFITVTREEVMLPATVVDIVVNSDVHNTLEAAVIAAELADDLSGEGPFTVFAPTDDAFAALPEGTVETLLQDPTGDLANILLYHVLGAKVLSTDLSDGQVATTLLGEDITVTINDDGVFINDAQVIVADLEAQNGVVHVIDAVLLPPDPCEGVVDGGTVALEDGSTEATVTVGDGVSDFLSFMSMGANADANFAYVITDDQNNILGIPDGNMADFDNAGAGVCRVWGLSYTGEVTALPGDNAGEVALSSECFALSTNFIVVNRIVCADEVAGGTVALEDGSTEATIIAGDGQPDVLSFMSMGAAEGANFTYVITDDQNNILGIPDGNMQDFEGAGPGVCRVWGLSYTGEITAMGGDNAAEVDLSSECFELSSNFITVTREEFMLPETVVDIIVDSDIHTTLETAVGVAGLVDDLSGEGPFTVFAPTDDAFAALPEGVLAALLEEPTGDLTNILLYHVLSGKVLSTDLSDGQVATTLLGEDITVTINDDGVFINNAQVILADLEAQNGVVHVIDAVLLPSDEVDCDEVVEGGTVALEDGSTEATIIAGDGEADVLSFMSMGAAADASFAYVITDDQNNILGIPDGNMQDFEGAGPGVCRVWGLSYTGEITAMGGDNAAEVDLSSECFELSSNFITVTREEFMLPATVVDIVVNSDVHNTLEAAVIAAELADDLSGEGPFTVFAPTDDAFAALPEGTVEALLQDPTGDLANILLYHVLGAKVLSTDLMDGQVATTLLGEDITVTINDDGVFINDAQVIIADLEAQNGVVHVIDAVLLPPTDPCEGVVDGGTVALADGSTSATVTVGDGEADVLSFTSEGANADANFAYVITDDSNIILGLPEGDMADFEGAGAGICRVWGLSYTGEITAMVGDNAAEVALSDDCFDLSDNFITVTREEDGGGELPATVVDIIQNSDDHKTLEVALILAGLIDDLSGEGPFTVFAPTDAAFSALPSGLLDKLLTNASDGRLGNILLYHVLAGKVLSSDLSDGQVATTLLGEDITVTIDSDGNVFINDAQVTVADIEAENGVVHVIDAVLVPEAEASSRFLEIRPPSKVVNQEAGETVFVVFSNTDWEITTDATDVEFFPSVGSGTRFVKVVYGENTAGAAREVVLNVNSTTGESGEFTLTQSGTDDFIAISPENIFVRAVQGNTTFDLVSSTDWTLSTDADWITLTTDSGSGNANVSVDYASNSSFEIRTGTITATTTNGATATINISQGASEDVEVFFELRPPSREVSGAAGEVQFVIFTNAIWNISTDADWVEFFGTEGQGTAFIKVPYSENTTGEARTAELDVVTSTGEAGTFTLTQMASGDFIISNPDIDATATIANFDLTLYPNPVSSLLNIRIDADEDRAVDVQVLDMNGKVVKYYNSQPMFRGENTIQIDVEDLTAGIYYFRMLGQDVVKQTKFIVAH